MKRWSRVSVPPLVLALIVNSHAARGYSLTINYLGLILGLRGSDCLCSNTSVLISSLKPGLTRFSDPISPPIGHVSAGEVVARVETDRAGSRVPRAVHCCYDHVEVPPVAFSLGS